MAWFLFWWLFGYLCGSVPFAYLAGRLRGIDIRQYGSRAVTGSNVYEHVSRPAIIVVGLLDVSKAVLPTWLALRVGPGLAAGLLAGLGALVGHNWPLYLGFHGGRGISASVGALLPIFPLGAAWASLFLVGGRLFSQPALGSLLGYLTLPMLAWVSGQPELVVWTCVAILGLILLKRLEANRETLPPPPDRWIVLARRLLLDRSWADWEAWLRRSPEDVPYLDKEDAPDDGGLL